MIWGLRVLRLIRGVALALTMGLLAHGAAGENLAAFDFAPASPWEVPFPNDIFTLPSPQMATRRRVNLPLPADAALVSERKDVESVNVLDGFSIYPRITIPLSGSTPDPDSFNSDHVFLVVLAPVAERGRVIPIDQRIIDTTVPGAPRLVFAPDEYLAERSRYAIVVTRGLTGGGEPFGPNTLFQQFAQRYQRGVQPNGIYEALLFDAMAVMEQNGIAASDEIVTLSVFTTRTVSDIPVKLMQRLINGEFPIGRPRFDIDGISGYEAIRASDIENIETYVHRASIISDGAMQVNFPPGTLRVQDNELEVSVDIQRRGIRGEWSHREQCAGALQRHRYKQWRTAGGGRVGPGTTAGRRAGRAGAQAPADTGQSAILLGSPRGGGVRRG